MYCFFVLHHGRAVSDVWHRSSVRSVKYILLYLFFCANPRKSGVLTIEVPPCYLYVVVSFLFHFLETFCLHVYMYVGRNMWWRRHLRCFHFIFEPRQFCVSMQHYCSNIWIETKAFVQTFWIETKKNLCRTKDVCSDIFVLRVYSILCFNATLLFKHITHLLLQTFWVRKEAFCSDIIFCLIGSTAEEAWKNLKRMSNVWIILGCQETLHACKHFDSKVFGMLTVEILHQKRKK